MCFPLRGSQALLRTMLSRYSGHKVFEEAARALSASRSCERVKEICSQLNVLSSEIDVYRLGGDSSAGVGGVFIR